MKEPDTRVLLSEEKVPVLLTIASAKGRVPLLVGFDHYISQIRPYINIFSPNC